MTCEKPCFLDSCCGREVRRLPSEGGGLWSSIYSTPPKNCFLRETKGGCYDMIERWHFLAELFFRAIGLLNPKIALISDLFCDFLNDRAP